VNCTREEDSRAMESVAEVRAPPQRGASSGKRDRDPGEGRFAPSKNSGSKEP